MKAQYINPFILNTLQVMRKTMKVSATQKAVALESKSAVNGDVQVSVGLTGELSGDMKLVMDTDTARKMASTLMLGLNVESLDDMAQSAVCELANIIAGNATIELAALGLRCDITPPSFYFRNPNEKDPNTKALLVNIQSDLGDFQLGINTHRAH